MTTHDRHASAERVRADTGGASARERAGDGAHVQDLEDDAGERAGGARPASRRVHALVVHLSALTGAVLVAVLVHACAFETYRVASDSMSPALRTGDNLLVNKLIYGAPLPLIGGHLPPIREPRPGDVLLFRHPDAPDEIHVKRCAAVPGGRAVLPMGTVPVPDGMLFVLGDNAGASSDSREWGFLPRELVVGNAACIVWSQDARGVRWGRILRGVGEEDGEDRIGSPGAG